MRPDPKALPQLGTEPPPSDPSIALEQENETLACFAWEAMLDNPTVAVALFRSLTQRAPKHVDYWAALGVALAKTNQRTDAIAAFETAVQLRPTHIEVWCALGELLMDELQWKRAADALKRCIALDPKATHPHGLRARALVKKGEKLLEKALGP